MTRVLLRRLPATALAATILLEIVAVAISWGVEAHYDTLLYAFTGVAAALAGALIWSRHPENRIGILLCLSMGVFNAGAADVTQGWSRRGWPGADAAEAISLSSWLVQAPAIIAVVLLFPTGRVRRPAWRLVAWASVAGAAVAIVGFWFGTWSGSVFDAGVNPFAIAGFPGAVLFNVGVTAVLLALVSSVVPIVQRFRGSDGVERQQLKWFGFAVGVAVVILPAGVILWNIAPVIRVFIALALTGLPVAICVAILRYRLYDIDVVINRTLVYGALTATLAVTYAVTAVAVGALAGQGSAVAAAAATLAAAVAFRPVRRRVQDTVDRRFDRDHYDALRQVRDFLDDLRVGNAEPEQLEDVLRTALGDPALQVHLALPGTDVPVDIRGRPVADAAGGVRWPIRRRGVELGAIVLGDGSDRTLTRLPELSEAADLAVELIRLRVELRRQLAELTASRGRLAAAADHERRRLERDLHDGAQQRLVSIGLALRHAQHSLGDASSPVSTMLDGAVDEISAAIDELREIARGLRPSQLDGGLAPALRDLGRRAPIPVDVRVPSIRFPDGVESAAYFTVCEALTNAVKHSGATRVLVQATVDADRLVVAVRDDGVGGASETGGSGLIGLRDRVSAQGGTIVVDSRAGGGTTLTAEFPCES